VEHTGTGDIYDVFETQVVVNPSHTPHTCDTALIGHSYLLMYNRRKCCNT